MPVAACDVNLFAVMAGTTKQDAFTEAITQLAQSVKNLDEKVTDQNALQKPLVDLMNRWLEFANSFNQFPPEWGRNDPDWKHKFSDLGMIIGQIRRQIGKDKVAVHDSMLRFSRRLTFLYEYMPMGDQQRLLLEFTRCFDGLWNAFSAQDRDGLKLYVARLKEGCEKLHGLISDKEREHALNLAALAERLRVMSTQINAFQTVTLRMTLSAAEAEFVSLNEKLSAALKSDNAPQ